MSPFERKDFIMRQIRVLAATLARIAGLRVKGEFELAGTELEAAYGALLGPSASLLRNLDVESLALLVPHQDRLVLLAQLVQEEGRLLHAAGNPRARLSDERALKLALEALRRDPAATEAADIVAELGPEVDAATLNDWQKEMVERVVRQDL